MRNPGGGWSNANQKQSKQLYRFTKSHYYFKKKKCHMTSQFVSFDKFMVLINIFQLIEINIIIKISINHFDFQPHSYNFSGILKLRPSLTSVSEQIVDLIFVDVMSILNSVFWSLVEHDQDHPSF